MLRLLNRLRARHAELSRHADLDGFDEQFYLRENPDIANAVAGGRQPSGRSHYLRFGRFERRIGRPTPPNPPGYQFPAQLPPRHLRRRVHGIGEEAGFEWVGKNTADSIVRALSERGTLNSESNILDFGCGCGRVIAYLRAAIPGNLFGSDIDGEAIGWCKEGLGTVGQFVTNDHLPPLPFADRSFDLVYSISVFTHLPEDLQDMWLAELSRVTTHGGLALISVQGPSMLPKLPAKARTRFVETGFLHIQREATDGLPDFYQRTFHADHYLRSHWGRFFDIEAVLPGEIAGNHDLVIGRKK